MRRSALAVLGAVVIAGACSSTESRENAPNRSAVSVTADVERLTCWEAPAHGAGGDVAFDDATEDYGLIDPLTGMHGHAAAWGDVDGNGLVDLFVGTFADRPAEAYRHRGASGPSPDRVLQLGDSRFEPGEFPEVYGRSSGAVFADLDGDGLLDLVVARNPREGERASAPTTVYANRGDGALEPVDNSGIDPSLGGRSVGVLDFDGDGLLDLFIVEDIYEGGSSRLYRNLGEFGFEDVTRAAGIPLDVHGLGLATGDVNLSGWTDLFVGGSNRLFIGNGQGFEEASAELSEVFAWETFGDEDLVAGAAFGDVNRDGWPDLVVGHHYNSTVDDGRRVPVRLYLNRTSEPGRAPSFIDVTDEAGLVGLPTKAPDVALVDLDNDGWPDLMTTASADGGTGPAIFRHSGELVDGVPRFVAPSDLGDPQYWISGPIADIDRDGRSDLFLLEWEPSLPSRLLRNTSDTGHWVSVSVGAELGGGVGTRVTVFEPGQAGDVDRLVTSAEITASEGYTSGSELIAHLGLGTLSEVDLVVSPPHQPDVTLTTVPADRHLRLPDGC